ncbi:MAG TPA: bifunctional nuclease family protein [Thermotogaceae bacterium]|nr:bifunctional nuclease family protein [Thermotogaceae bacterium]
MKKARIKALLVDKENNSPVVLVEIENSTKVIPIWIGAFEAWAMAMAIENIEFPRPLTHDLLVNCIESLHGKFEKVVIHSIRDNTYFASLYVVDNDGNEIEIDSRPSDAIVLSLKRDIPLYVANKVISESGIDLTIEAPSENEEDKRFRNFVKQLDIEQFREMMKHRESKGNEPDDTED